MIYLKPFINYIKEATEFSDSDLELLFCDLIDREFEVKFYQGKPNSYTDNITIRKSNGSNYKQEDDYVLPEDVVYYSTLLQEYLPNKKIVVNIAKGRTGMHYAGTIITYAKTITEEEILKKLGEFQIRNVDLEIRDY